LTNHVTTIQTLTRLPLLHTSYKATITSTLRISQATSQQIPKRTLAVKTTTYHFTTPHHIIHAVKMVNFTSFITLIISITTFFNENIPGARRCTTWSQKLLAAPPPPYRGYEEMFIELTAVTVTTTFTYSATPTFTSTIAPPVTDLALFTGTITTTSFYSLAKKFVCAMFTVPAPLTANASSLVTAFLFGTILLMATVGFLASSPPVMKPEDLALLESQVAEKDELVKNLRRWYDEDRAEFRRDLQVSREGADKLLSTTIAQHRSAMATKDREIRELRQELAGADLREEQARLKSSDEVIKLHKEIGHLRRVIDGLDQKLEDTSAVAAVAEEAQEKVKIAEERAIAAAQQALEANQKVEAAEKAHKEEVLAVRDHAQAAIYKATDMVEKLRGEVKVKEYMVQGLEAEVKELKAGAVGAAPVPTQPVLVAKSSATIAEETRARIKTAVDPALGASSVPAPEPAAAPRAVAPVLFMPGQLKVVPRPRCRQPAGPFADKSQQGRKK
jgi:hypothetical protein